MDFYAILGLSTDASLTDIKRAYRRMARRYHPGINPGDRAAEEMFRRVSEAYETLVDPRRREEYDAVGRAAAAPPPGSPVSLEFTEFDFSVAAHGPQAATFAELFSDVLHPAPARGHRAERGADLNATITIDFLDAIKGVARQLVMTRHVLCSMCAGTAHVPVSDSRCHECHGSGGVRWARGHMVFSKTCAACNGSGRLRVQRCALCNGLGRTVRSEPLSVSIPPGTIDGTRLRLAERGHAGENGGPAGDVYVTVQVLPHPFLRREREDLVCVIPLGVHEAVLGSRIDVPTLDGPARFWIPPGTQAGQRFRLVGRGVPSPHGAPGDLVVEVKLVLPTRVDERSRDILREFGQRNYDDLRKGLHI
jgi:molecular chaperone DnaJ